MPVGSEEAGSVDRPGAAVKTARGVLACSVANRFGSKVGGLDGKLQASIKIISAIRSGRRLFIFKDYNCQDGPMLFAKYSFDLCRDSHPLPAIFISATID